MGEGFLQRLLQKFKGPSGDQPEHLRRGELGEREAKRYLVSKGLCFLTANYRGSRGEIDLVFEDQGCIAFVEVKTRSSGQWTRPAAAVDARKRRLLSQTAMEYVKSLKDRNVRFRFDIVEVLLDDDGEGIAEIRHLPNTFEMTRPYRHG